MCVKAGEGGSTVVARKDNMTVGDLIIATCAKRKLHARDYYIQALRFGELAKKKNEERKKKKGRTKKEEGKRKKEAGKRKRMRKESHGMLKARFSFIDLCPLSSSLFPRPTLCARRRIAAERCLHRLRAQEEADSRGAVDATARRAVRHYAACGG